MVELLSGIASAVANHIWQSTLFASAVWLVNCSLRRNAARVRFTLWLAASVKFLIPFSLLAGMGGLLTQHTEIVNHEDTAVYSAMDAMGQPFAKLNISGLDSSAPRKSLPESTESELLAVLVTVWVCGGAVVLITWYVRHRRVQRQLQSTSSATRGRELAVMRQLNGGEVVSLALSRKPMEPKIFGIFRPVLIWPEQLSTRLNDAHIKAILTHELMHVRRRDNLSAAVHMLVEAAFWFHPMVWWIEQRLLEERERACDEAVIEMCGSAEIYAESLLRVCRFCIESPMVCASGISGGDLSRRIRMIMTVRVENLDLMRRMLLALLILIAIAGPVVLGACTAEGISHQAPSNEWQREAGGKLEFDVASIRMSEPGTRSRPNMVLNSEDTPVPNGGFFTADFPLEIYIEFAYKIMPTREQEDAMLAHLPKWVRTDHFVINAKFSGDPTKDQIRLMMQSLLADRFKLIAHYETREMPVFALVMNKPGELGPRLRPHSQGPPCDKKFTGPSDWGASTTTPAGDSVDACGRVRITNGGNGTELLSGRNISLDHLAGYLPDFEDVGRPIVDQTRLKGTFDFSLGWLSDRYADSPMGSSRLVNAEEPPFLDALKEQLGLKLKPARAPIQSLIIDHVERPTPN